MRYISSKFKEFRVNSNGQCRMIPLNALRLTVPGITVFFILPSTVFYYVEGNWTYLDSIYYAFVSLTTIGYGDLGCYSVLLCTSFCCVCLGIIGYGTGN